MSISAVLAPVFVQVLLTFIVWLRMGQARTASLRQTRTHPNKKEVALGTYNWSEQAAKAGNNFSNQFELPVLFYAVVAFALIVRHNDIVFVALAWAFVVARIIHAAIHLGPNVVSQRFAVYVVGAICVFAMWALLAVRVLTAGA
jgi:hypothetical protein